DVAKCVEYARDVNPNMIIFQVSALTGEGLNDWYQWLGMEINHQL
ncbi:MAG: hydrogenase accessory protein HypB, partial [Cyanobacteria bacterium J06628_3]